MKVKLWPMYLSQKEVIESHWVLGTDIRGNELRTQVDKILGEEEERGPKRKSGACIQLRVWTYFLPTKKQVAVTLTSWKDFKDYKRKLYNKRMWHHVRKSKNSMWLSLAHKRKNKGLKETKWAAPEWGKMLLQVYQRDQTPKGATK